MKKARLLAARKDNRRQGRKQKYEGADGRGRNGMKGRYRFLDSAATQVVQSVERSAVLSPSKIFHSLAVFINFAKSYDGCSPASRSEKI